MTPQACAGRAEEVLESKERESPETEPLEEVERLLHELRVHQIELRDAERGAAAERRRSSTTPPGGSTSTSMIWRQWVYLTLSEQGLIARG